MTGKELPCPGIARDRGVAHVHHRVLDMSVPQPILHERDIRTGVQKRHRHRVATHIITLLIMRRWLRSVTRTIPSADKPWRLADGYGADLGESRRQAA
jgi:hypothetical protein